MDFLETNINSSVWYLGTHKDIFQWIFGRTQFIFIRLNFLYGSIHMHLQIMNFHTRFLNTEQWTQMPPCHWQPRRIPPDNILTPKAKHSSTTNNNNKKPNRRTQQQHHKDTGCQNHIDHEAHTSQKVQTGWQQRCQIHCRMRGVKNSKTYYKCKRPTHGRH